MERKLRAVVTETSFLGRGWPTESTALRSYVTEASLSRKKALRLQLSPGKEGIAPESHRLLEVETQNRLSCLTIARWGKSRTLCTLPSALFPKRHSCVIPSASSTEYQVTFIVLLLLTHVSNIYISPMFLL